jgi:hypothetical protein
MDDALQLVFDSKLLSLEFVYGDGVGIGAAVFFAESGFKRRVFGL